MQFKRTHTTISDPKKDNRVKLSEKEKQAIKIMFERTGKLRATAREFGISHVQVYYLVYPDKLKENRKLTKDKGGTVIYEGNGLRKKYNQNYQNKIKQMKQELLQDNIFYILRGLRPNQLVNRLILKDKNKIHDATILVNDLDHKQLEISTASTSSESIMVDYSQIESLIFKS